MSNRPRDSRQRDLALDPERSFIVQAPAGSGKTELLIRRFLVLLGRVDAPEQIIAITFTRKAAAEMRNRVVTALQAARGPRPEDPVAAELWQLAQAATERDQAAQWQLAMHPSRLQIQTIDSLCLGLVRRMPWLSRCGAPLTVIDDATDLYRQAAQETVHLLAGGEQTWAQAVEVLLRHLDYQVETAVTLLSDMLGHRDQWLRKTGNLDGAQADTRRGELESAWRGLAARYIARARSCLQGHDVAALISCANHACRELDAQHAEHSLRAWGERFDLPDDDDPGPWQALCGLLLKKSEDAFRSKVTKREGFPTTDRENKQHMEALLKVLADDPVLLQALAEVRRLPPVEFLPEQWEVLNAINTLLPLAAARLQLLFAGRGVADFTEINHRANFALGGEGAPTDLALKLDYRIQHLLVDEFQDTSYSQFMFLERLTAGWQMDDGRSMFLVGDPKQSIYRFREAEVGLFQYAADHGIGEMELQPLQLTDNFRSDPGIVDWVNRVLPHAFPETGDAQQGAIPYHPSFAARAAGPDAGVFVHALARDDARFEALEIVQLVKDCRARRPDAEIAILARSRTHLLYLLPALQHAGVPCVGVDTQSLARQPAVQDIMALTRALLHTADRIAWLAVLRAPWCGLRLEDLYMLVGDGQQALWARLRDETVSAALTPDARQRLARVVPVLERALAQRGRGEWRRLVESTWVALGGPAVIAESAVADVETYLDLLADSEHDDAALMDLEQRVAGHWAAPQSDPRLAVQVMTMHKAKGLQFDVVVLPSLLRRTHAGEAPLLRWEEDPELGLLLAPRKAKGGDDGHHDFLGWLHKKKDHLESGRLLYVACTRAKHELHLLAAAPRDANGAVRTPSQGLLALLWPGVRDAFTGGGSDSAQSEADIATQNTGESVVRRLPPGWRAPHWEQFALDQERIAQVGGDEPGEIEFSWAGEEARHVGVLVHEFLQLMATSGLADWDHARLRGLYPVWRQELAARGLPEPLLQPAVQRIAQALERVLADPRARWLMDPAQRDRHSEFAVSVWRGGRVRSLQMDLTFVDEHERRWIVDYKTSAHEGGDVDQFLDREVERYRDQLHGYAQAMAQLDQRPIHLALYFPLLQAWREWRHI